MHLQKTVARLDGWLLEAPGVGCFLGCYLMAPGHTLVHFLMFRASAAWFVLASTWQEPGQFPSGSCTLEPSLQGWHLEQRPVALVGRLLVQLGPEKHPGKPIMPKIKLKIAANRFTNDPLLDPPP